VKYEEWTLDSVDKLIEDNLERMVVEHSDDIFGQDSIYLDKKYKLKTITGIGSIPDGFAIIFSKQPEWHIVEVELSSHDIYEHVVKQVTKFIDGIKNLNSIDNLVESVWNAIESNYLLKHRLEKASGTSNPHWFLSNIIKKSIPSITLIIEKEQQGLKGTLSNFTHLPHKIVEFQTFRRAGAESVHAHLFQPLYETTISIEPKPILPPQTPTIKKIGRIASKVTFGDLVNEGLLKDGQILHFYHHKPFLSEKAKVIASSNQLKYEADEKASHDLVAARILFKANGPADIIAELLQQAVEKGLKGYLISKGWQLKKTHDLVSLIKVAQEKNPDFSNYLRLSDRLTALYIAERYPTAPSPGYPKEEIASLFAQTEKPIAFIKKQTS
jgi:HEPN domain-containing protein